MTTVDSPATARVGLLAVRTGYGTKQVTAEWTASPHLRITPCLGEHGELTGQWRLTHTWTGLAVTLTDGLEPCELRDVAVLVGDHPGWAATTREQLAGEMGDLRSLVEDAVMRAIR